MDLGSRADISTDNKQYQKDKDGNFYLIDRKKHLYYLLWV